MKKKNKLLMKANKKNVEEYLNGVGSNKFYYQHSKYDFLSEEMIMKGCGIIEAERSYYDSRFFFQYEDNVYNRRYINRNNNEFKFQLKNGIKEKDIGKDFLIGKELRFRLSYKSEDDLVKVTRKIYSNLKKEFLKIHKEFNDIINSIEFNEENKLILNSVDSIKKDIRESGKSIEKLLLNGELFNILNKYGVEIKELKEDEKKFCRMGLLDINKKTYKKIDLDLNGEHEKEILRYLSLFLILELRIESKGLNRLSQIKEGFNILQDINRRISIYKGKNDNFFERDLKPFFEIVSLYEGDYESKGNYILGSRDGRDKINSISDFQRFVYLIYSGIDLKTFSKEIKIGKLNSLKIDLLLLENGKIIGEHKNFIEIGEQDIDGSFKINKRKERIYWHDILYIIKRKSERYSNYLSSISIFKNLERNFLDRISKEKTFINSVCNKLRKNERFVKEKLLEYKHHGFLENVEIYHTFLLNSIESKDFDKKNGLISDRLERVIINLGTLYRSKNSSRKELVFFKSFSKFFSNLYIANMYNGNKRKELYEIYDLGEFMIEDTNSDLFLLVIDLKEIVSSMKRNKKSLKGVLKKVKSLKNESELLEYKNKLIESKTITVDAPF